MKKIIVLSVAVLINFSAKSQILISLLLGDKLNSPKIEFGMDGGWSFTDIQGLDNGKDLSAFNLGFYFDFKLKNPAWTFNTGVIVKSPMGCRDLPVYSLNDASLDSSLAGGYVVRKLRYFSVPLLMKYTFKNHFFIKGGPQLALINKAYDEFNNKVVDKDDLQYVLYNKGLYHKIDAGITFGIGYRLTGGNGMNIGINYYQGLVDITKDNTGPAQYNQSFYLNVGIPIGVAKKTP